MIAHLFAHLYLLSLIKMVCRVLLHGLNAGLTDINNINPNC